MADTVVTHGGQVIKNLGDEVLFVSGDPVAAADTALVVAEEIGADQRIPPVHSGLASGVYTGLAVTAAQPHRIELGQHAK